MTLAVDHDGREDEHHPDEDHEVGPVLLDREPADHGSGREHGVHDQVEPQAHEHHDHPEAAESGERPGRSEAWRCRARAVLYH